MPDRTATIARSAEYLSSRDYAAARQLLLPLCGKASPVDDATQLLALTLSRLGQFDAASTLYEQFLRVHPNNAAVWNNFGNHLKPSRPEAAQHHYRRALELNPRYPDALYNLALCQFAVGQLRDALQSLDQLAAQVDQPREQQLRGVVQLGLDDLAAAQTSFTRYLAHKPDAQDGLLNLAIVHRRLGEREQALEILARAPAKASPALHRERCALLQEVGEIERSYAELGALVARVPGDLEAHAMLDNLDVQLGRSERVGATLREAYHRTGDDRLLGELATRLEKQGRLEEAGQALASIPALLAADPRLLRLQARLYQRAGDPMTADAVLATALGRFPGDRELLLAISRRHIQQGEFATAALHLEARLSGDRRDQEAWALQATLWKLTGDSRYPWLCDYDSLVREFRFDDEAVQGGLFQDMREVLDKLHGASHAPPDQTLRNGTQTFGALFNRQEPPIAAVVQRLREFIGDYIAQLPPREAQHPLLSRAGTGFNFSGSWSVKLARGGFHINHVHPRGWISSALYLALPASVSSAGAAGCLQLGRSNLNLDNDLDPVEKIITPQIGKLVLFPSYFWHGTMPFSDEEERLSIAFDVAPLDESGPC